MVGWKYIAGGVKNVSRSGSRDGKRGGKFKPDGENSVVVYFEFGSNDKKSHDHFGGDQRGRRTQLENRNCTQSGTYPTDRFLRDGHTKINFFKCFGGRDLRNSAEAEIGKWLLVPGLIGRRICFFEKPDARSQEFGKAVDRQLRPREKMKSP